MPRLTRISSAVDVISFSFISLFLVLLVGAPNGAFAQSTHPKCFGLPSLGAAHNQTIRVINDASVPVVAKPQRSAGGKVQPGTSKDFLSAKGWTFEWYREGETNARGPIRKGIKSLNNKFQCLVITSDTAVQMVAASEAPKVKNSDPRCQGMSVASRAGNVRIRFINSGNKVLNILNGASSLIVEPGRQVEFERRPGTDFKYRDGTPNFTFRKILTQDLLQCFIVGDKIAPTPAPKPVSPTPEPKVVTPAPMPKIATPAPEPRPTRPAPQPIRPPSQPSPPIAFPAPSKPTQPSVIPLTKVPRALLTQNNEEKKECTQADLAILLKDGQETGNAELDGNCRYVLDSASSQSDRVAFILFKPIKINGNGAIIERKADAPRFGLFQIQGTTTFQNLTLRNGSSRKSGGALLGLDPITLLNVTLENNLSDGGGGAVMMQANLSANNVTMINNKAGGHGGALSNSGRHDITITNSRFIGNQSDKLGGAIFGGNAKATILNSVFAENSSKDMEGTAFYVGGAGSARLTSVTIARNALSMGSAIESFGDLVLRHSIVANHNFAVRSYARPKARVSTPRVIEHGNLIAGSPGGVKAVSLKSTDRIVTHEARFVDPIAFDFRLTAHSPAVNRIGADQSVHSTDIDGQARPKAGTLADIGASEFDGNAGPVVTIKKDAPYWLQKGIAGEFTITVANEGMLLAQGIRVQDAIPEGARFITGSLKGTAVRNGNGFEMSVANLAPGQEVTFSYQLAANASFVSRDYAVSLAGGVTFKGAAVEVPVKNHLVAYLDFFPRPDGFKFANFVDLQNDDLTDADLIEIFGRDAACKNPSAANCALIPKVTAWRTKWLSFITGGRCAGMAMGSLDIFASDLTPQALQSTANLTFDLGKPNARRLITKYATTQTMRPANRAQLESAGIVRNPDRNKGGDRRTNPVDVLNTLIANLNDPAANDRFRIGFSLHPSRRVNNDGKGHTVVPFAVEQIHDKSGNPTDWFRIYLYENNRPGNFDLAIMINRRTGQWSYSAQTNPASSLADYNGDKGSDNLRLTSWKYSTSFPMCLEGQYCDAATDAASPAATADAGFFEVSLNGEGRQLVTRSDGARVGFDPNLGRYVSEIEGAEAVNISLGFSIDVPPVIKIPHTAGMTYNVTVVPTTDKDTAGQGTAALHMTGATFTASLQDLTLKAASNGDDAAQVSVMIAPDENKLSLQSLGDTSDRPTLSMVVSQTGGVDLAIEVKEIDFATSGVLTAAFDKATQALNLSDSGAQDVTYDLSIDRLAMDGTRDHYGAQLLITGPEGLTLALLKGWPTGGAPSQNNAASGNVQEQTTEQGSITLQSVNYPDRVLTALAREGVVHLLPLSQQTSPDAAIIRFVPVNGIADPSLFSLSVMGTPHFVVAIPEGVGLLAKDDISDPAQATFKMTLGLSGEGFSFESLAFPGHYLRHSGFVLKLHPQHGSILFQEDSTFLPIP